MKAAQETSCLAGALTVGPFVRTQAHLSANHSTLARKYKSQNERTLKRP